MSQRWIGFGVAAALILKTLTGAPAFGASASPPDPINNLKHVSDCLANFKANRNVDTVLFKSGKLKFTQSEGLFCSEDTTETGASSFQTPKSAQTTIVIHVENPTGGDDLASITTVVHRMGNMPINTTDYSLAREGNKLPFSAHFNSTRMFLFYFPEDATPKERGELKSVREAIKKLQGFTP